jgi:hypothetical protein
MQRKERASLMLTLLILIFSLFLLSVLSNILAGYPSPHESETKQKEKGTEVPPQILLFEVSPAEPRLFWSISTADYYTGFSWLRTTDDKVLEKLPPFQVANSTKIFTVEMNTSQREIFLPLASSNSAFANVSLEPHESLRFYMDAVGSVYKVIRLGEAEKVKLVYQVSWNESEIDDGLISLDNIQEEILKKYLQLPNVSPEIRKIAEDLKDPSYGILDQVLADVQFLKTNFVYDTERSPVSYESITQGSDVNLYLTLRKGICIDAATALAVILRIQQIPSRISFGYKPGTTVGNKALYFTSGGHAVTEAYLPPYGWVQFDATPPLEEDPSVKVSPFKKQPSAGGATLYQLSITNKRNLTDSFKIFVHSRQNWYVEAAPGTLRIDPLQTADALLNLTIPDNANSGEKDMVTATIASINQPEIASSVLVIAQVENVSYALSTTAITGIDKSVIRGETFWVNGTVLTANGEQVDNMTTLVFVTQSTTAQGITVGKGYSKQGSFQIKCTAPYFIEIGDYKVVPISLGTTRFAPSSTDSIMKFCATTRMEFFGSTEEFLMGYGAIYGRLLWDNKTGIENVPISLMITSLATPSELWTLQNQTRLNGLFKLETTFKSQGAYELRAMYFGNEYVLGSNATRVVKLKTGLPAIQISAKNITVRGEVFNITGAVQFEGIGVLGEPVTLTFDNRSLATVETGDNGHYAFSFAVDSAEKLGSHIVIVALKRNNLFAVHKVAVKSKTMFTTKASSLIGGMVFSLSASLTDDHGLPVQGAEIFVDNYALSGKTDNNGNSTFLVDIVRLWPEDLKLTVRYQGSEFYLPATAEEEFFIGSITSLPFLLPLVSPILFVVFLACAKCLIRSRQTILQTSDTGVVKAMAIIEEAPTYKSQESQLLKILLPDIEGQFPNVWGINDTLHIVVVPSSEASSETQKGKVEVSIDKKTVASVRVSGQGHAEFSHTFFHKGEHNIRAIIQGLSERRPGSAEVNLRIVDYKEEIVRLYNEFVGSLASYGINVRSEMTGPEIQTLILRMGGFTPQALNKVTTCFEKAEYSNHLASRKDYEIMYLSLKELNMNVE